MTENDAIIDDIIAREGGYVDHPADRGGPTNFGITLTTLGGWRGRPVTAADVRGLSRAEAKAIYADRYIKRPGFDRIADAAKRAHLVDCAVLHGPGRAIRLVQEAVGARIDGIVGPETTRLIGLRGTALFNGALARARVKFLARIVARDPSQAVFLEGWMNRATGFLV